MHCETSDMAMDVAPASCPECGGALPATQTCQDHFNQVLAFEYQHPAAFGAVHHLTVMCYNLQHPGAFTDAFWHATAAMLTEVIEQNLPASYLRERGRRAWAPQNRPFKITGTPTEAHMHPWTMRIIDIVTDDPQMYVTRVQEWARSIVQTLKDHPVN